MAYDLRYGDCFKLLYEIPDKSVDLILTDPPYNVDYEGSAGKIKNDKMAEEQFEKFLFAAYVNMEQSMTLRYVITLGCCPSAIPETAGRGGPCPDCPSFIMGLRLN